MKIQEIYKKYLKAWNTSVKDDGYINIVAMYDIVHDMFENGYIVSWYEFLRITDEYTQPFMEYSIWRKWGYTEGEIIEELDALKQKILIVDFQEDEIFFDILVKSSN